MPLLVVTQNHSLGILREMGVDTILCPPLIDFCEKPGSGKCLKTRFPESTLKGLENHVN
jgi:hypothetical protein